MSSNYTQPSSGFGRQDVQPGSEMEASAMGRGTMGTSDTNANQPTRTAAEDLQSTLNPSQTMRSDVPGRGFGAGSMPASSMGTGTRTGMGDVDNPGVGTTQFDERTGALSGGHHSHMHPQSAHQVGDCDQPGCATCMDAKNRDVFNATDPSTGSGHPTIGHHTTEHHATGHHTDTSATGGTPMAQQSNVQSAGQHKPTMTDKIIGGAEKMAGKVTGSAGMETRGAERKAGESVASNKN